MTTKRRRKLNKHEVDTLYILLRAIGEILAKDEGNETAPESLALADLFARAKSVTIEFFDDQTGARP
jgi:hypothetical protein